MGVRLLFAALVVFAISFFVERSEFLKGIEVGRSEDRLVKQTMIYAHQVTYDNINHFGFLVRDPSPGGTVKAIPGVGTKRFGIRWTPKGPKALPELMFQFCDPRFPSGKSPIYGLEDVEWGICRRDGTVMTATVTFLGWDQNQENVRTQLAVTLRNLREKEKVWITRTQDVLFPVPKHG